jgi:hypothetical protein
MLDAPYRLRTLFTVRQLVCLATAVAVSWMLQSQFSLSDLVICFAPHDFLKEIQQIAVLTLSVTDTPSQGSDSAAQPVD